VRLLRFPVTTGQLGFGGHHRLGDARLSVWRDESQTVLLPLAEGLFLRILHCDHEKEQGCGERVFSEQLPDN